MYMVPSRPVDSLWDRILILDRLHNLILLQCVPLHIFANKRHEAYCSQMGPFVGPHGKRLLCIIRQERRRFHSCSKMKLASERLYTGLSGVLAYCRRHVRVYI